MKRLSILVAALAVLAWGRDWIPPVTVIPVTTGEAVQARANQRDGRIFPATLTSDVFDPKASSETIS
jgi:hypothetical protein